MPSDADIPEDFQRLDDPRTDDEYRDGRLAWKMVAEIRRVTTPQANRLVGRQGLEPWTR